MKRASKNRGDAITFTPISEETAKKIRLRANEARFMAEGTLWRVDIVYSFAGSDALEDVGNMSLHDLNQLLEKNKTAEGRQWNAFLKTGNDIISDVITARTGFNPGNPDQQKEMASLSRRVKMYRQAIEREKTSGKAYFELVSENFEVGMAIASAEKAMRYEDALKFYELGKPKGEDAAQTRVM